MKKVLLAVATTLALSSAAHAASTTTLKVIGKLTNGACTPEVNGGAAIDFGLINLNSLSPTESTAVLSKSGTLSISCSSATKVAWSAVDDRSDSKANVTHDLYAGWSGNSTQGFGLGKTAGGVNLGAFAVSIENGQIDGATAKVFVSQNNGSTWKELASYVAGDNSEWYSVGTSSSSAPESFTTATYRLSVKPVFDAGNTLNITDTTDLDGQMTINLRYL